MADPVPSPISLENVTVVDPATGQIVLTNGVAGMVFSDLATLTVLIGQISYGGPAPGSVYTLIFQEDGHQVTFPGLTCQPPAPQSPPYIFMQTEFPTDGVDVSCVNAFDNDAGQYVIKGARDKQTPNGTLYRGDMTLVTVKADTDAIKNGGPILSHNNSVHYILNGYQQTLSNMMFQGVTADGLFIFQQADN